jgi:hypothetical protein
MDSKIDTFRMSELLIGFYIGNLYAYSSSIRDYYFLFNVIMLLLYIIFIFKEQGNFDNVKVIMEPVLNITAGCILSILFNTFFSSSTTDNSGFIRVSDKRSELYWNTKMPKQNRDKNKVDSCYNKYKK